MKRIDYNISKFDHCYRCVVCVLACPTKIISLRQNNNGFFHHIIDEQNCCIKCGLCLRTCAYNHDQVMPYPYEPKGFSGWSNNKKHRLHTLNTYNGMCVIDARGLLYPSIGRIVRPIINSLRR